MLACIIGCTTEAGRRTSGGRLCRRSEGLGNRQCHRPDGTRVGEGFLLLPSHPSAFFCINPAYSSGKRARAKHWDIYAPGIRHKQHSHICFVDSVGGHRRWELDIPKSHPSHYPRTLKLPSFQTRRKRMRVSRMALAVFEGRWLPCVGKSSIPIRVRRRRLAGIKWVRFPAAVEVGLSTHWYPTRKSHAAEI